MKRNLYCLLLICFFSTLGYSQTTPADTAATDSTDFDLMKEITNIFSAKVEMEVDTTVFNSKQGNFYLAEKYNAIITVMVVPQDFETAEEHSKKKDKKEGYKVKEKGQLESNGKRILFEKGVMKKEGKKMLLHMFVVEATKEKTIFISGMFLPEHEQMLAKLVEQAAKTAHLAAK